MNMPTIKFSREFNQGVLLVDGINLSSVVSEMTLNVKGGGESTLTLGIAAYGQNEVVMDAAGVSIKGVLMPASVELALYEHLKRKHGPIEVTVLSDDSAQLAVRDE
ncbi:hypothetical protein [Pseudomonas sp.]|uniref:hypothetical protein n=1 Tax=Pseudomonas sp. TaxID=306 RepID=UPI003F992A5E